MEWVASTLHTTSEHGVSSITTADAHTPRLSVVDRTDAPADLNGLVHFAKRRNLVYARVPSHFNWPLATALPANRKQTSRPTDHVYQRRSRHLLRQFNPYSTRFPYGNGMVLHFYQQQESSTTKTVNKVINKRLKTYV